MNRTVLMRAAITFAAAAAVATGCASYTVTKQATPNPFTGQAKFVAEPVAYADGVSASAEIQQEIQKSWREELGSELEGAIQLLDAPEAETPAIRVRVVQIKEGTAMNLQMDPAVLDVVVQLVKGEEVLDEIQVKKAMTQAPGVTIGGIPTAGYDPKDRLGSLADDVAEEVASYLESRIAPQ